MTTPLMLAEEYGLPVFPCGSSKQPLTPHGFKDASNRIETVSNWWDQYPDALTGIPTGKVSKLLVVDVDPEGLEWYRQNAERLACGYVQRTQRGHHLFYRYPEVEIRNSAGKLSRGVDVRGEGGYVVAWGTQGLAATGSWDDIGAAPAWLVEALTQPDAANGSSASHLNGKAYPEGQRNDILFRLACRLRRSGLTPDEILGAISKRNATHCSPPLPDAEVANISASAGRYPPGQGERDTVGVTLADFYAYMPMHTYIFAPSGEMWPSSSVNARITAPTGEDGKPVRPSEWLDQNNPVEQMTWFPGEPVLIEGRLISNGGWITRPGCRCFNLYRPPQIALGDPAAASRWLDHVKRVYPDDHEHIIRWLAHRVQRPQEKINHALVLGGGQGIGKDTILEPVKYAVGPWNFSDVSPAHLLGRFNGFVKSTILRVSEARDLGDVDRYAFYDHTKVYTAAPPDVLRCDEKNLREYTVPNVCGVVITTNHKTDGIYLPADDRRHYVAWSELSREVFTADYWTTLYGWYEQGGHGHVTAYLRQVDLSGFDAKAPPPKTPAFYDIVDANRAPEDADLADILDACKNPGAITLDTLIQTARNEGRFQFCDWLSERKNRRVIPHRLESAGYTPVRNDAAKDGLWKFNGKRQAVYALRSLPVRDRIAAASTLRVL